LRILESIGKHDEDAEAIRLPCGRADRPLGALACRVEDDPDGNESSYPHSKPWAAEIEGEGNRDGDRGDDQRQFRRLHPRSFSSASIAVPGNWG